MPFPVVDFVTIVRPTWPCAFTRSSPGLATCSPSVTIVTTYLSPLSLKISELGSRIATASGSCRGGPSSMPKKCSYPLAKNARISDSITRRSEVGLAASPSRSNFSLTSGVARQRCVKSRVMRDVFGPSTGFEKTDLAASGSPNANQHVCFKMTAALEWHSLTEDIELRPIRFVSEPLIFIFLNTPIRSPHSSQQ